MFNLRITVTINSYLSLEKFREHVYRIMWIQGNIWVVFIKLMFDQTYVWFIIEFIWKIWRQIFLRQECIWLVKLEKVEGWRKYKAPYQQSSQNWIFLAELSIKRFVLTGYCSDSMQSDSIWNKLIIIQDVPLIPFYPVSGRPLFLPGMSHIASSPSKPSFKNVIMMKRGRLKGYDKKFQIP